MSDESLIDDPPFSAAEAPPIFSRPIQTPPGLPWDQKRAAELEARAGSPVTDPMIQIIVTRRAPWRPRQPGLFQAEYLRPAPNIIRPFEAAASTRWPTWLLGPDGRLPKWVLPAGSGLGALCAFGLALTVGAAQRAENARTLAAVETELSGVEDALQGVARSARNARALEASGLPQSDLAMVLADIAWLARSRTPEAQLGELQWQRGVMMARFGAPGQPFAVVDRPISLDATDPSGRTWRIDPAAPEVSPPVAGRPENVAPLALPGAAS